MSKLKISGGFPLNGTVTPMPNKNSILKLIPACVLADEPVTIHNVPKSSSVRILLQIFKQLGGKVAYLEGGSVKLDASTLNSSAIDEDLAGKERSSFVFLGALLSRFGNASIKDGGGCKLGNRPLDTMFQGLEAMGVEIDQDNGYKLHTKGLNGNDNVWLIEASVTGTENLIIAAVKAKGKTVIYNAACEPHTQDLCNFLVSLGAQIQGIGTNKLTIEGVEWLSGGEWSVIPDHVDIGGMIVAAAITGGEVRIKNAIPQHMTQILNYYAKLNLKVKIDGEDIIVPANQNLKAKLNVKGDIDKIVDQPWPGFPADLIPQALMLALKSKDSIRVYSNMYEIQFLELFEKLLNMKAKMILANPNEIITFESDFVGAKLDAAAILQSTHALVLAALVAKGTTIINNADIIYRRFPEIVQIYRKLGAKIEKI